jgi:hypothetical protein
MNVATRRAHGSPRRTFRSTHRRAVGLEALLARLAAARASTFVGPQVIPNAVEQSRASLLRQRDDLGTGAMNENGLRLRFAPVLVNRSTSHVIAADEASGLRRGRSHTCWRGVVLSAEDLAWSGGLVAAATQAGSSAT